MQSTTITRPNPSVRFQASKDVTEAAENVAYWRRQVLVRTQPQAIAEAKGLASAWESTRKARQAKLDALSALTTDL